MGSYLIPIIIIASESSSSSEINAHVLVYILYVQSLGPAADA